MREIFPGVFHWSAFHRPFGAQVSSYFVEPVGLVVDPKVPDGGFAAFDGHTRPQVVVLTSGNHDRDAEQYRDELGCIIRTSVEGAERIGGAFAVETFDDHDDLVPGVHAIKIDVLAPDEYSLHLTVTEGAITIANGITHYAHTLGFFGDDLLGEDPSKIKEGLKNRYRAQLARDFDHVLFAHGDPIVGHGKTALRDFVTSPVGHEDFGQTL
jgi:hypothetical protein